MYWNGKGLTGLAEVEVGASGMHALVTDTNDGLAASNGITNGTVARLFADVEAEEWSVDSSTAATIQNVSNGTQLDESVRRVLFSSDAIIACLAGIKIGAFQTLEAVSNDAVAAEIAGSIMGHSGGCAERDARNWRRLSKTRGLGCVHMPDVHHHLAWSVQSDELVTGGAIRNSLGNVVLRGLSHHASVTEIEVRAINTLVANADNRVHAAPITGHTSVGDRGGLLILVYLCDGCCWEETLRMTLTAGATSTCRGQCYGGRWDGLEGVVMGGRMNHSGIARDAARAEIVVEALVALVAETANMFAAFIAPDTGVKPLSLGGRLGLLPSSTFDDWIPKWVVRFALLILV